MENSFRYYFRLFLKLSIAIVLLFSLLLFSVAQGWLGELPSIEYIKNPSSQLSSTIFTEDFEVMGKLYYENRTELTYKQISASTIQALIATEDERFYEHSGIDVYGVISATFRTFILGKPSGASTITQQLAKNLFHAEEGRKNKLKRIIQKIKEWYIAIELERNFSKQEILALYFNTVPFLHNSFGLREASKTYFNKEPIELTLDESAILVGMLKGPSLYNPKSKPANAIKRRDIVLDQMRKAGFINQTTAESAKKLPIKLDYRLTSPSTGLAPYLREEIRMELNDILQNYSKEDGEPYDIYADGLKIYTTINSKLQKHAEEAVAEHMPWLQKEFLREWGAKDPYKYGTKANPDLVKNIVRATEYYKALSDEGKSEDEIFKILSTQKHAMRIFTYRGPIDTQMSVIDSIKYVKKILQVGLCAIDPQTGKIRAWVGGVDFNFFKYDHVRKSTKRQAGSTFKPFLYNVALENGMNPCSKLVYEKPLIEGHESWDPKGSKNFQDGEEVTIKDGLQVSDNRIAALLIKQFGPSLLIDKAKQLGIDAEFEEVPAISLGTTDISVIEMVGAYSPYMNGGIYSKPYYIERIEDKDGNVIFENKPESKEAIQEEVAKLMNLMLQQVSKDKGTAARLRGQYGFKEEIACKTGTTQSNSDGWFIGSTSQLLTAVWVGADDPSISFASTRLGQGANTALPIWAKFYKKATSIPKYKSASFFSESDSMIIKKFDCNYQDDKLPVDDDPISDPVHPDDTMPILNDSKTDY
jgi:penicillin-binding protein 1A